MQCLAASCRAAAVPTRWPTRWYEVCQLVVKCTRGKSCFHELFPQGNSVPRDGSPIISAQSLHSIGPILAIWSP